MGFIRFCGMPYDDNIVKRLSLWMLANAFSKSPKLIYSCCCHYVHCSIIFLNVKRCNLFLGKNLLFLFAVESAIRLMMIFVMILLGMDSSVMPCKLLQSLSDLFFAMLIIVPLFQAYGFSDFSRCP